VGQKITTDVDPSSSTARCASQPREDDPRAERAMVNVTQGRIHSPARTYLERKQTEGKSRREAIRCLKRQLARTIYTTLKNEPLLT
jgi:transposase